MVRVNVCLIQRFFGDYTCPNNNCLFYKQFKYGNCANFQTDGTCEYCSAFENCTACLARKYTAFNNYKEATVYHCGQYYRAAKEILERSSYIVRNTNTRDCSTAPQTIQSTHIIADLRSRKNWQEVEKSAKKTGNVNALSSEKIKRKKVLQPDGVGFKAIKELKAYADLLDPFFVYNINDSQQNIFKNSTSQMKIALEMNFEDDRFLKYEY